MNSSFTLRGFIILFFAFLTVIWKPVRSQPSFSDTLVESMMNNFRYNEAKVLIKERLKHSATNQPQARLYYNNQLSFAYYRLKEKDSALNSVRTSLWYAKGITDSTLIKDVWKAAAFIYNLAGNMDSSIYFSNRILRYGKRNSDLNLTRNALNSLAAISNNNEKPHVALQYFKEVYQINQNLKDTADFGGNLFNLGFTFMNLSEYDSSLFYLKKSTEYSKKYENNDLLILTYNITAGCYSRMENYDKQDEYLRLSEQLAAQTGNNRYTANNLYQLMLSALRRGNYQAAVKYGEQASRFLMIHPSPVFQLTFDSLNYVAQKNVGNVSKALEYYESYVNGKTIIYNEKQLKTLNEIIAGLELEQKNLIIKNQKIELISKQQYLIIIISVMIILFLLIVGLTIHIIKTRRFRHDLYLKEKHLESQIQNLHEWMEWKQLMATEADASSSEVKANSLNELTDAEASARQSELFAEFYHLCENEKIYLDPELTQEKVIKRLGSNKKYLYEAISANTNANFKSLINRYRVNEAKRQIYQNSLMESRLKMEDIMLSSGFTSSTSFYRVFKSITGLTPSEYATETKIELNKQKKE